MTKRKGWKVNAKGRNESSDQYYIMPYVLLHSEAWRGLKGSAVKVWLEIRSRFNGRNNGKLFLSLDEGARLLGMGKQTVGSAFKELEAKGFLVKTKQGHWYGRQASEWRATDVKCDGQRATNEWKQWTKSKKKQSLGFIMEHNGPSTGPFQNRRLKIWSVSEPVRPFLVPSIGSRMDRYYIPYPGVITDGGYYHSAQ